MTVRRFLCPGSGCPRRIFVEPLDGFAARHARTTTRLAQTHLAIGLALGGEAGARLAEKTAVPTSPDTLLRRVKQAGARSSGTPRFVGIDDWAWCKGQRYGTIVVDLETSDVIDLLPDRDAATVKDVARGSSRHRTGQPRPFVGLLPGRLRGRIQGPAGRRSMAPVEERARGRRTPVRASSAGHHGGPQTRRSRSGNEADASVRDDADATTATEPTPRNRRRPRLRPHLDRKPRWPSDSGASSGSSGSMNSIGKGRRSDRSPETSPCRGRRCVATSVASNAPTGGPDGPHARGWTRTGSGSMPASPRVGSTHPSCIASSRREAFDSRTPRSVAISPSVWDGPARRVPG